MKIEIGRENCSKRVWMALPADEQAASTAYKKLETMHPSMMRPFLTAVVSDIEGLGNYLGDCLVFQDGHMEWLNALAKTIDGWSREEKTRFTAGLKLEAPEDIEGVIEVARHLDSYVLEPDIKDWKQAGRLALKEKGMQINEALDGFLDYERIGMDYIKSKGCMTPMGYVRKKKTEQEATDKRTLSEKMHYEGVLTIYLTDDDRVKHLFCLPFMEHEKNGPLYKKFASSVITDAKGTLGNLPHYLPPGVTLSELNRVAEEVSKSIQRAGRHRDKLFSILEAGMPENIEEACSMIQRYEDFEVLLSETRDTQSAGEVLMKRFGLAVPEELTSYFRYDQYVEMVSAEGYLTPTSFGYVFTSDKNLIRHFNEPQTIQLYSPLTVSVYWDAHGGWVPELLEGDELIQRKDEIETAIIKHLPPDETCLGAYVTNQLLRRKLSQMVPGVEVYDGQLWGVLKVKTYCPLTKVEHDELLEDWKEQAKNGWGKQFLETPVYIEGGEMYIGYWDCDYGRNLSILTEEERNGESPLFMELT